MADLLNSENTEIKNKVLLTDMVRNNCCEVWQNIYKWENALKVLNECEVKELCESVKTMWIC